MSDPGSPRRDPAVLDFAARHRAAVDARGRLCAGIDPHPQLLQRWGLGDDADGLRRFADICVEALGSVAAVIKPQVAFFERFGSRGLAVLEETIGAATEAGALVLADAKRGDIGTTMAAYAHAWLGATSPLCSDAVTVSPYLGFGSLQPALDLATATGRGVVVLARTSNPEGGSVQLAQTEGISVAQSIIDAVVAVNSGPAAVAGVVVGATRDHGLDLSGLQAPILAPGLGAQGATAADLAAVFTGDHRWLLPAASREILAHGPSVSALSAVAARLRDELEAALD
ncbi:orotidine-5'-phosphate decarboxylase [Williamsia sp. CHRR-6]|uniref:orotidine-5'-phosphate decarboxylase n=1 Tax=Williamsia sp. CHRR-6 TaxID=2835871 RepID=UPI001BD975E7|nr:orotidine-5'-phosphate decarboxylase [Williamsia sp. CHRR-6]MBT0568014.1 orotidine-5'-phosphate decarboxylase [Williamsia sp. CHRR-6]